MKTKKNSFVFSVQDNAIKTDGEDKVLFTKKVNITDDSEQYNGLKYDIPSMQIEWDGKLTANHSHQLEGIVGRVIGLAKSKSRITIEGIEFAIKESALARFARDMLVGGFATDFSIETTGPWPEEDGTLKNSILVGCSMVVKGNNKSATLSQLALNSLEESRKLGLDTEIVEDILLSHNPSKKLNNDMTFVTIKNDRSFAVKVAYKNAAGEDTESEVAAGGSVDVSEDQGDAVGKQIKDAKGPTTPTPEPKPEENSLVKAVSDLIAPITSKMNEMEKNMNDMFDKKVEEPGFRKTGTPVTSQLASMNWKERGSEQIKNAWDWLKGGDDTAKAKLRDINKFHMEELKKAGKVENAVTLGDFGNFVISPEQLTEIEGFRSDFKALVSRLNYRETLSLQMAWLKRDGDINMQEVEMCDDGEDGNLKPISDYEASIQTSNLHELAAVTPVCNSATRFLAADLLSDINQGYRTDYDRKLSQLFIARLQQAVNETGQTTVYATTSDTNALKSWVELWGSMQEEIMNGVYIFNRATYAQMLSRAIGAGISGPLSGLFTTGDQAAILGDNYIIVPNELMPTLNTAQTKTFAVEGTNVTINQAVFYVDISKFSGRVSGGLNYDLSTEAAYEESGTVKSAFQRNELVLRGSFFRGGKMRDTSRVVGMGSGGVS